LNLQSPFEGGGRWGLRNGDLKAAFDSFFEQNLIVGPPTTIHEFLDVFFHRFENRGFDVGNLRGNHLDSAIQFLCLKVNHTEKQKASKNDGRNV
jgi:hypothetical protein